MTDQHRNISWVFENLYVALDGITMLPHIGTVEVMESDVMQGKCRIAASIRSHAELKTIARILVHKKIFCCSLFSVDVAIPEYLPSLIIEETSPWDFYLKVHWALLPYVLRPYHLMSRLAKQPKFLMGDRILVDS